MNAKCPGCNYLGTEHETLEGQIEPIMGDISFCINCSQVNEFTKTGLVKTNLEELDEETREEVDRLDNAWVQTRSLAKLNQRRKKQ